MKDNDELQTMLSALEKDVSLRSKQILKLFNTLNTECSRLQQRVWDLEERDAKRTMTAIVRDQCFYIMALEEVIEKLGVDIDHLRKLHGRD